LTPAYHIKENSWLAALAARKLKSKKMAMVIGKTIHLHRTSREEFEKDTKWVKHELCHVRQFREHGFFPFIIKYLYESFKHGYRNNKYELEANAAERS
jgi:hypothetical protein